MEVGEGAHLALSLERPNASQRAPLRCSPRSTCPARATQPWSHHPDATHGRVDAAKQRMEIKPRPTLALSQTSQAHSPNTSHIHWLEPLGQLEKLLEPSFLQAMASEGGREPVC